MQTENSKATLTSKGVHIFSVCDATSEKAQDLQEKCEAVRVKRTRHIYQRDKRLFPLQLKLKHLNQIIKPGKEMLMAERDRVMAQMQEIGRKSKQILDEYWREYRYFVERLEREFKTKELVIENVTTTVGRSVLAQRLGGDTTYTGTVNYTALGSDNTAAAVGDATLGTEVYRKALSSGTDSSNIAYIETFFTSTEVTGTFEEYGMFIDGTGTADTGQLFNRFVSSITKSSTETLNVQSIITFNDA